MYQISNRIYYKRTTHANHTTTPGVAVKKTIMIVIVAIAAFCTSVFLSVSKIGILSKKVCPLLKEGHNYAKYCPCTLFDLAYDGSPANTILVGCGGTKQIKRATIYPHL